jgi:H+-transporting ATPase
VEHSIESCGSCEAAVAGRTGHTSMEPRAIDTRRAQQIDVEELFRALASARQGLSGDEARRRLDQYGPNALEEEKVSAFRRLVGYFWGPIPWMIEVAAVLSAIVRHWDDFGIICALLIFNAGVGFWQEFKAANALDALKQQLALKARALRDGRWGEIDAKALVPGDVVRLRLGDIVPADVKLFDGSYLSIDQSALTGESLPVGKKPGDVAYSGSLIKQGEMLALVTATAGNTYFGRTAKLVETAAAPPHFQKAVLSIGDYLIYLSLGLVGVLILAQLFRHTPLLELVQFALILTVASIPVAMPAVLSVTMAVGAMALSRMKAIVSRLESIEEMAGIDVLCSDKTGTLTQNQLTLGEPALFGGSDARTLMLAGALASTPEDPDAIDAAVLRGLDDRTLLARYRRRAFTPFDPVGKRTEAEIQADDGQVFRVSKGAPQVILGLCGVVGEAAKEPQRAVDSFAARGYRALGVARTDAAGRWQLLGILPLFDPPRPDSKDTIAQAKAHGIAVKMVTGDNAAIGREIAGQLGLGRDIQPATALFTEDGGEQLGADAFGRIAQADGFAEVFPEHKYEIVKVLQGSGHLVAMTGDGVNDAPALKQADVGIAVSGATDAARAAADLVLTSPGLAVIVNAVEESRRIFERMNSYAIYRITETIRIMIFVVAAILAFDFYPITAIMIILLAFFNDIPIMTIAYDNTWLDPKPVRWNMRRVIAVSTVMGATGTLGSFLMLYLAVDWLKLDVPKVQTYIFLKMAVAGHLTLFVARARGSYVERPYPAAVMIWSALGTKLAATLLCAWGLGLVTPIGWRDIALVWGYSIAWSFVTDRAKIGVYRHLSLQAPRHRRFLGLLQRPLHPHGQAREPRH